MAFSKAALKAEGQRMSANLENAFQERKRKWVKLLRGNYYTMTPNATLEYTAADESIPLKVRVLAVAQLWAWGRYSETCISGLYDETPARQTDIARYLAVARGSVSKALNENIRRGTLRMDDGGRIVPVLDPAIVASKSSPAKKVAEAKARYFADNPEWARERIVIQRVHADSAARLRKHDVPLVAYLKAVLKTSSSIEVQAAISDDDECVSDISNPQRIDEPNVSVTDGESFHNGNVTETPDAYLTSKNEAPKAEESAPVAKAAAASFVPASTPAPFAPVSQMVPPAVLVPEGAAEIAAVFGFDDKWGSRMLTECRHAMPDVTPAEIIELAKRKYNQLRKGINEGRYTNTAGLLLSAVPNMASLLPDARAVVAAAAAAKERERVDDAELHHRIELMDILEDPNETPERKEWAAQCLEDGEK